MAVWVRMNYGGAIPTHGNPSSRAMNTRPNDEMSQLRSDTGEFTHLRRLVVACSESDARRTLKEDPERSGGDIVRRERNYLRVRVALLEGRIDELRGQVAAVNASRDDQADKDGRRVRHRMDEGMFGSDQGPQYRSSSYGGGYRSTGGLAEGVV